MLKRLLIAAIFLADCHFAFAFKVTPTGTEALVEYQEPNTNQDGTPLDDLKETTIYYSTDPSLPTPDNKGIQLDSVPATSPNGNGQIQRTVFIPALDVPDGQDSRVFVWATATDDAENESVPSEKVSIQVDRLAPGAPK